MANGIDIGDAAPTLEQGVAQARDAFDSMGGNAPAKLPPVKAAPPLRHGGGPKPAPPARQGIPDAPRPELAAADAPSSDNDLVHGDLSDPAPPAKLAEADDPGDDWSAKSIGHFLRDTFKGTGAELTNLSGRVLAGAGDLISSFGSTPIASLIDKINDAQSDAKAKLDGKPATNQRDQTSRIADTVLDFRKNYILPAIEYWTPDRAPQTGEGSGSGGGAQAIGTGLEGAAPMLAGAAALPLMVAKGVQGTAFDAIDKGEDPKTAMATGIIDGLGGILQAKYGVIPTLPMLKRIITAIPLGDMAAVVKDYAKKLVLHENGYQKHAEEIDPWGNIAEDSVSNAIFGVIGGHKKAETAKVPEQTPAAAAPVNALPSPEGDVPAAAVPASPAPAAKAPTPAPQAASTVPDQPSAESSKDLRAQIKDMNDAATPRTGVLVTTDSQKILAGSKDANAASVNGTLNQARTQGRTIDLPQGTLILKTKKAAEAMNARLKAGEDPQAVIGSATGAGDGKDPSQTVVVQGQTPSGAVAAEKMVTPDAAPQAAQHMVDQGKTPVVTTPDAAITRRMDEISKERNDPTLPGIMTTPSGKEVAVHVESGAADGFTRVRAIDADGEPSDHTVDVPAERVKVSKPEEAKAALPATTEGLPPDGKAPKQATAQPKVKAEETPTGPETRQTGEDGEPKASAKPEVPIATSEDKSPPSTEPVEASAPEPAAKPKLKAVAPKSALDTLPDALEAHEAQEQIPPGKKFPASLAERQDNASAFAAVLREAAKSAAGKASPGDIERATAAAKAAERLTEKGKAATDKGQGTGHTKVTALVSEMHKAARALLGTARDGDAETVAPKVAELKAKLAKPAAKPKEPKASAPKEDMVEVPVNPKYKADIKPAKPKAAAAPTDVQKKVKQISDKYIWAENGDDAKAARTEVEQFLHEHFADQMTPQDRDNVLHLLDKRRFDENPDSERPRRMSDTVDEEESMLDPTETYGKDSGYQKGGRELLSVKDAGARMKTEWSKLSQRMAVSGGLRRLVDHLDTGKPLSSHDLLASMMKDADTPILKAILGVVRTHMPDVPVYVVSGVKSLRTGELKSNAQGLFDRHNDAIQVALDRKNAAFTLRTALHEMVHAATAYEISNNKGSELNKQLEAARQILLKRLGQRYGESIVNEHLDFFQGRSGKPAYFDRNLYGIANTHEMLAELFSNPNFQREIAESENFKHPDEAPLKAVQQ
nr:hypothetical protein [Acidobacteriota bacterium]